MSIDRRILIADDDVEVRSGAAELLGPLGLHVVQAGTGDEALAILRGSSIHLALLDVHMPGQGGFEVFQTLREETLSVPCIIWSGDASDEFARYTLRSGASAFLRKPVEPDLLRDEVQRVLEEHWGPAA